MPEIPRIPDPCVCGHEFYSHDHRHPFQRPSGIHGRRCLGFDGDGYPCKCHGYAHSGEDTPPDPGSSAHGPHSPRSAYLGPYAALPFDDEPPTWDFGTRPGALWVLPEAEYTPPEPAIPIPADVLAFARAWDGMWAQLLCLPADAVGVGVMEAAMRACWLSIVGPRTCTCPDEHRWNCGMTPIWANTVHELETNPAEPIERWRAYCELKFLPIRINRGFVWDGELGTGCGRGPCCLGDNHDGRCQL